MHVQASQDRGHDPRVRSILRWVMSHCQLLQHSGLKHMRHAGHPCQVSPAHTVSLSAPSCPGAGILSAPAQGLERSFLGRFYNRERISSSTVAVSLLTRVQELHGQKSCLYGTIMRADHPRAGSFDSLPNSGCCASALFLHDQELYSVLRIELHMINSV